MNPVMRESTTLIGMPLRALSQILEVGNLSSAALPPRLASHAVDDGCTGNVSTLVAFRKWSGGCAEHWPTSSVAPPTT